MGVFMRTNKINEWKQRFKEVNVFQQFDDIIQRLEQEYLHDDQKVWQIGLSGGKDSSLLTTLVWQMLLGLNPEQRKRPVHIVMADTMVETPLMENYQKAVMRSIEKSALEQELDDVIHTHYVQPPIKSRFFFKLIGRGSPYPSGNSNRFCTHHMKIAPMQKTMEKILSEALQEQDPFAPSEEHVMVSLLGVRSDESTARKASINNHTIDDLYARHSSDERILVMHPIRDVTLDELWAYLESFVVLPYGVSVAEMKKQYGSTGMECGIKDGSTGEGQSCGQAGSRSGCWTCGVVSEDKMLIGLIEEGHKEYKQLLEWKEYMVAIRNDIRFRLPTQRGKMNKSARIAGESSDSLFMGWGISEKYQHLYETFNRSTYEWIPGAMTIEARKRMLEYLLWVQERTGYCLIEEDELQAIYETWKEDGYLVTEADITPAPYSHKEKLVMRKDGTINEYVSNVTSFPIFYVKVQTHMDHHETIGYIRDKARATGQYFPCLQQTLDYEEENLAFTELIFVVCSPFASTHQEAKHSVFSWLDWKNPFPDFQYDIPYEGWCPEDEGLYVPNRGQDRKALSSFVNANVIIDQISGTDGDKEKLWHLYESLTEVDIITKYKLKEILSNKKKLSSSKELSI